MSDEEAASVNEHDSDNESLREFAQTDEISRPKPDARASSGAYAASVSSSRNGRRRPPPLGAAPMTVPEFVAQLHVEDVKKRLCKHKSYLEVTPTKPAKVPVSEYDALDDVSRQHLSRYALTQRAGAQFRAAKSRHEARLREQTRSLAAAAHAAMPKEMSADGEPVVMNDDSGRQEKFYLMKDKEKQGGASPGLGAALDIVVAATEAVLKEHAPDYVDAFVTSDNVRQVLALIFREDVGARLMQEIDNAVRDYKRTTMRFADTVRLVDEETWRKKQSKQAKERRAVSSAAIATSLLSLK